MSAKPLSQAAGSAPSAMDLEPGSAFEVAIDERLKALQADVDRIRSRMDWLLTVIVGAALLNVLALLK